MLDQFEKTSSELQEAVELLSVNGLGDASPAELRAAKKMIALANELSELYDEELACIKDEDEEDDKQDDEDED
jgi:hypothetical protein